MTARSIGGTGSLLEVGDAKDRSGLAGNRRIDRFSDSRTQRTLLERLTQPGDGNQAAWAEFVDRYGRKIYGWCLRWGLRREDAQDVTQVVLLKLVRRMKEFTYDPSRRFRAWLKTVTHHAWRDFVDSRQNSQIACGGDDGWAQLEGLMARDDLSRELEGLFDLELLEKAMQQVRHRAAPHTWAAFSMTAVEGIPAPEVALRLDMKVFPGLGRAFHHSAAVTGRVSAAGSFKVVEIAARVRSLVPAAAWGMSEAMRECPTRPSLEEFLAGELADEEERALSIHLDGCASCRLVLETLVEEEPTPWRQPGPATDAPVRERDLSFLDNLRTAVTDPAWAPPRWVEADHDLTRSVVRSGSRWLDARGPVPGYEILGELGRGAMGVVYKARQLSLGRLTALKMILAGEHASLGDRTRFRAEAEAAGSMRHPHIVQVYETGEAGGLLYFSMEYIEGGTLKQRLQGRPQPPRAAALLLEVLARAVASAHRRGIVHRDLKPANVLLEAEGAQPVAEEPAGYAGAAAELSRLGLVPKIADFGLAKRLGDTLGTRTGQLMGTPSYMSPEQLAGQVEATGPAVDIYALGCILYEALTGRPPYLDEALEALAERVRREEPVPPRRLQPRCPRDLETICLKCLEKEPARRYGGASELADDLGRFLAGEPIRARAPSTIARCLKFSRRHRPLVVGLSAVMAALALGMATTTIMAVRESRARHRADENARRATDSTRQATESAKQAVSARTAARREAYQARLAAAMAAIGHHDLGEAASQLAAAPEELRSWEWRHLQGRLDQSLAVVAGVDWSSIPFFPPGRRLALAEGRGYRLFDAKSGETIDLRATDRPCHQVFAFETRVGSRLVLNQSRGTLSLSITDGEGVELSRIAVPATPANGDLQFLCAMAMSPDGTHVAFQGSPLGTSPLIDVFETSSGRRTATCGESHSNRVLGVDFSPDGTRIAAAAESFDLLIFDAASGRQVMALAGHTSSIHGVAYSPDGRLLVSSGQDETIRVWDAATGRPLQTLHGHDGGVHCVAFSRDGQWIASGGEDSTVRLWSTDGGAAVLVLHGHTAPVRRVAFSADGRTLASTAADGTARLWDATAPLDMSVLRGHSSYVYAVAYSPDGRRIASAAWDRTIRVWDAMSGNAVHILSGHTNPVGALAFTPDGTRLASWGEDRTIRVWDTATGEEIAPRLAHESMGQRDSAYSLIVSPDGRRLGAVAHDGVRFWDLATRAELAPLRLPIQGVRVAAFSPDGTRIVAGGDDPKVVVVDTASGALAAEISGFAGRIQSVAFSPDGRQVLTAGRDAILRLWDATDGHLVQSFGGHGREVMSAIFHPDGTRIASGGHDRSIRIWDVATGDELVRLPGHSWYVFSLAFGPDGRTLVSGSGDSTVRLWDDFPIARRLTARSASERSGAR
jgi:RNA polymerase sigma factor (sigma-70 family)